MIQDMHFVDVSITGVLMVVLKTITVLLDAWEFIILWEMAMMGKELEEG